MKGIGFLLIGIMLFAAPALAQLNGYSLAGTVMDSGHQPVAGANAIVVSDSSSMLIKADITNEKGGFKLEGISNGTYRLKVMLTGYEAYTSGSITVTGKDLELPVIGLKQNSTMLKEVTVQSQKPLIEIKADRLIVNVESSIVNTGSSVLEVLGRSPGVTVDQNDNISLKGKQGLNIMIDGKTVPVSGSDLANILKNMPSASVEKIEIISNPGARFDAAGSAGVINIKTKKEKRMGVNGSLNGSYGQGIYHKSNVGANLNYRTGKLNINASYNYADHKGFNHLTMTREFYSNEALYLKYTQENNTIYPVSNHIGSVAVDYNLNTKMTIGAVINGYKSHFEPMGDNASRVDSINTSYFTTTNRSIDDWYNYSVNGYLRYAFDTSGKELEVNLDYARYWNQTYQNYVNKYEQLPDYLLYGDLSGTTQIRSLKMDYVHPLKNGLRLEAGVKASYVTADTEPTFYDKSNGTQIYDPTRSNHFIYRENINAGYINASNDIGKWSIQAGLRAEQTITTGIQQTEPRDTLRRDYLQLFPSLALQRHLNDQHDLGITISRRIDRPTYNQLNPFKFFLDPTNSKVGNPYLKPSLTWAVELSHTFRQRFVTSLSFSVGNDVIVETLEADTLYKDHSIQTDKNLAQQYYYGLSCAYSFRLTKWWNNVTNLNAYYSLFKGNLSKTSLSKGSPAMDINTTNSFTLPGHFTGEVSLNYQSPQVWGFYELKATSMLNLGIQRSFLNKKLSTKLGITDIFLTGNPAATIVFNNFTETFVATRDSRILTLSLVYLFGRNSGGAAKRHSSGAEEEKRRAANN